MDYIVYSTASLFLLSNLVFFLSLIRKRKIQKVGVIIFIIVGILFSMLRFTVFLNLSYKSLNHTSPTWLNIIGLITLPDTYFIRFVPQIELKTWYIVLFFLFTIGSFLWSLPFLLIGSKKKQLAIKSVNSTF
jgi:hypothetical protein